MSTQPPQILGKYQIIREIARSNDIVYEGYDPVMNRRVALKELNISSVSGDAQREERRKRFEREVRAAGSLAHPNIVTIFEFGEQAGRTFMAMEYLDGRTLRNELDTVGMIPLERALEIAKSILSALGFAHSKGVIHRDVKPENIQLLSTGVVKLTDFGIARLTFEPNITLNGQVFGTPSYMSPEQVIGKDLDARSDLFSAGAVLYEMLCGSKAFQGDNVMAISHAIVNVEPTMPPHVPHGVSEIVRGLLNKTVGLRFSNAEDAIRQIEAVMLAMKSGQVVQAQSSLYASAPTQMGVPPAPVATPYGGAIPPQHPQLITPGQPLPGQPYAGQPYAGQPYQGQVHPGQAPPPNFYFPQGIYTPKPKMPPLISPEQWASIFKFFGIVITAGLVMSIIVISAQQLGRAASNLQSSTPKVSPPGTIDGAAVLEEVKAHASRREWDEAARKVDALCEQSPNTPEYADYQGEIRSNLANQFQQTSAKDAAEMYMKSGDSYRRAVEQYTAGGPKQTQSRRWAALVYISAGDLFLQTGDRQNARTAYSQAVSIAPQDSAEHNEADEKLNQIS